MNKQKHLQQHIKIKHIQPKTLTKDCTKTDLLLEFKDMLTKALFKLLNLKKRKRKKKKKGIKIIYKM